MPSTTPTPDETGPVGEAPAPAEASEAGAERAVPSDDVKAKFREALEAKRAATHRRAEGQRNTGSVHGSSNSGPAQKMFRRKSG